MLVYSATNTHQPNLLVVKEDGTNYTLHDSGMKIYVHPIIGMIHCFVKKWLVLYQLHPYPKPFCPYDEIVLLDVIKLQLYHSILS